jgi:acyl-CoA thioester hydrolase
MFSFYHPITVRYRDLDFQGHVNNTVYLTYLESARIGYYRRVGIYHPQESLLTGMVVARNEIDYLAPIQLGQAVRVGLQVLRLGSKSITFSYQVETDPDGEPFARGKSVMVAYDNAKDRSIPLPPDWREKITQFEAQKGNHDLTQN